MALIGSPNVFLVPDFRFDYYCFLGPSTSTDFSRPRIMMISSGTTTGAGAGGGGGGGTTLGLAGLAVEATGVLRNPLYSSLVSCPLTTSIFWSVALRSTSA